MVKSKSTATSTSCAKKLADFWMQLLKLPKSIFRFHRCPKTRHLLSSGHAFVVQGEPCWWTCSPRPDLSCRLSRHQVARGCKRKHGIQPKKCTKTLCKHDCTRFPEFIICEKKHKKQLVNIPSPVSQSLRTFVCYVVSWFTVGKLAYTCGWIRNIIGWKIWFIAG